MRSATSQTPALRWLVIASALVACLGVAGQATNTAKKVLHMDGTVTEAVSDMSKGELRESTFDSRGVLLSKRVVLLNEHGLPVQGVIYSGRDELVGKVEFAYDDLGRLKEEISFNAQGQVFRRKIQLYDKGGKPLPTKIVDYSANAPKIESNTIDFTKVVPPPAGQGGAAVPVDPQQPKQPGQAPQIQTVSPVKPSAKPPEQKSFFNKLFKK